MLIYVQSQGKLQKKPNLKLLQGIIWEETKINANRAQRQKAGTGSMMNSAHDGEQWQWHEQC